MLPGDRLVCIFVEPQEVGLQFKQWLLHVTIVPWFRLDETSDEIVRSLQRMLRNTTPFQAVADGEALFGARKTKSVRLLQPVEPFAALERAVRSYLRQKRAWLVDETTKVRREFVPHVTDQGGLGLQEGAVFWCERLYIVEQRGGYKEIVGAIDFGETTA